MRNSERQVLQAVRNCLKRLPKSSNEKQIALSLVEGLLNSKDEPEASVLTEVPLLFQNRVKIRGKKKEEDAQD